MPLAVFINYMQNLNKQIEENKSLRVENDALKTENNKVKQRISQLDEKAVERVTTQLVCAKEELASAKNIILHLWKCTMI